MQVTKPYAKPTESKIMSVSSSNPCFKVLSRWFWCKFENYRYSKRIIYKILNKETAGSDLRFQMIALSPGKEWIEKSNSGDPLRQGSPTPGPQTDSGPRSVRSWAARQEVSCGQASEASSVAPHRSPSLALPPEPPTPHTPSVEILSSTKPVPGAKKDGDCCLKGLLL